MDSGPKTSGHRKVAYRNLEKGIALLGHGVDHDGVHPSAMPPVSNFMGVPVHKVPVSSAAEISSELEGVATFQDRDNLHSSLGTNVRQENSAGSILRHRPETSISSFVRVSGLQVSHLPKMDRMGKCDPYVVLELGGVQQRTKTLKNRYDAAFEEEFEFCGVVLKPGSEELILRVKDWDRFGKDEIVGNATVKLDSDTWAGEQKVLQLQLTKEDGNIIAGYDRKASCIDVMILISRCPKGLDKDTCPASNTVSEIVLEETEAGVTEEIEDAPSLADVTFSRLSVSHLPKMDRMGKCDPYLVLELGGLQQQTATLKNRFDAEFSESITFSGVETGPRAKGQLVVRVMDWDRFGKNEEVGSAVMNCAELTRYGGLKTRQKVELLKGSVAVVGHDRKKTTVSFSFVARARGTSASKVASDCLPQVTLKEEVSSNSIRKSDEQTAATWHAVYDEKSKLEVAAARKKAEEEAYIRKQAEEEARTAAKLAEAESEALKIAAEETAAALRRVKQEEEARLKAEQEAMVARREIEERKEADRKRMAEAEARRKAEEEQMAERLAKEETIRRQQQEAQAAEQQEHEKSVARRKVQEAEAREKLEMEALAVVKKAQEESEARMRAEKEAEVAKKMAQEATEARRRAEAEAIAAKQKAEEVAAARLRAEEEVFSARKRAEEDAKARRIAEEEAEARRKFEESEKARRSAEEAVRAKVREEEAEARRRALEEAEARRKAEEEEEEAQRQVEELVARNRAKEDAEARHKAQQESDAAKANAETDKIARTRFEEEAAAARKRIEEEQEALKILEMEAACARNQVEQKHSTEEASEGAMLKNAGVTIVCEEVSASRDSIGSLSSDDAEASPSVAAGVEFSQRSPWIVRAPRASSIVEVDEQMEDADAVSKLLVRVSGLQVSHLPKMDRMGKCDPYVVLELGGVQQRTKTLKNRYDAAFEEEFEFCDLEVEARAAEYLVFRVKDWDRFGKDEEIGVASIALGRDTALVVSVNQDHCLLGKKGKVFGHDGHATRISFVVSVRVYTDGPQKLESETAALRDSVGSLSSDDADASPSVAAGVEFSQRSPWVVRAPRVENVSENDKEQRENMSPSTTSADCNAVDVGRTSRTSLSPLQTPPQGLGEWEVAVTVHQVINLPKVDRNGTANPFVCCSLVRDDLLLHPNTIMHDCSEANRDSHYDHGVYAMPPCFRSQILRNRFSTRLKLFICCKQRFQKWNVHVVHWTACPL